MLILLAKSSFLCSHGGRQTKLSGAKSARSCPAALEPLSPEAAKVRPKVFSPRRMSPQTNIAGDYKTLRIVAG